MDLRRFNYLFLAELDRYRRDLRHLGTGHEEHPLLRSVLLTEVKMDLELDGFDTTYERWHRLVGLRKAPPLNLPPSPVLGLQLDFTGTARGGSQLHL